MKLEHRRRRIKYEFIAFSRAPNSYNFFNVPKDVFIVCDEKNKKTDTRDAIVRSERSDSDS